MCHVINVKDTIDFLRKHNKFSSYGPQKITVYKRLTVIQDGRTGPLSIVSPVYSEYVWKPWCNEADKKYHTLYRLFKDERWYEKWGNNRFAKKYMKEFLDDYGRTHISKGLHTNIKRDGSPFFSANVVVPFIVHIEDVVAVNYKDNELVANKLYLEPADYNQALLDSMFKKED